MDWGVGKITFSPALPIRVATFSPAPGAGAPIAAGQSFQFFEDSQFWNEVKYGQRFPCGWDERDAKV